MDELENTIALAALRRKIYPHEMSKHSLNVNLPDDDRLHKLQIVFPN